MSIDQQFIEYIVKSLVGNPDAVSVNRTIDEKGVLLELTVDPEDLGRVIGRRGSTAQSLRALLRALGTKNSARYNLKIVNNDQPTDENGDDTTPRSSHTDEPVDNSADEPVDNDQDEQSDYAKKSRQELADLDDLDI
jgi:predicted RNA-binding protein YlqC (UPF0109 family)